MAYWGESADFVVRRLKTHETLGLTTKEASRRLRLNGSNEIKAKEGRTALSMIYDQIKSPLVVILLIAAVIALLKRDYTDGFVIVAIVITNALIGFLQEHKAQKAISGLRKLLVSTTVVVRDGSERKIRSSELVQGDIVKLEAGDRVPADLRIIYCKNLRVNQAVLTGESVPVVKTSSLVSDKADLLDRKNMAYMSTFIVSGKAYGVVVAKGMETEVGNIASEIGNAETKPTAFQSKIASYSRVIIILSIVGTLAVFVTGLVRHMPIWELFSASLSLLVSVVPEQLPIAITIALSVGLVKMAKRKAIVRKLEAVEVLGSATVLCVDKTGTLTYGQMSVSKVFFDNDEIDITGDYLSLHGKFARAGKSFTPSKDKRLEQLFEMSALSSRASLTRADIEKGEAMVMTDPTEVALMVASARAGHYAYEEKELRPELSEIPFDQEYRLSASAHDYGHIVRSIVKGAPEVLLPRCSSYLDEDGRVKSIGIKVTAAIQTRVDELAAEGYRLVCLTYRDDKKLEDHKVKDFQKLTFVGVLAIDDPVRKGVEVSIREAEEAGIRVIMVTGDHLSTAKNIAERAGISGSEEASEARTLDMKNINDVKVVARSTPSDKYKLIDNLQELGEVVAMTGDGVNDAPALKRADIGTAIGNGGTDVAIESSDIVLLNNDIKSIVAAIKEGRLIWQNLQKIVLCLNATSIGELIIVLISLMAGLPLPLVASQILWLNLVTDGITVLPLAVEKEESDLMKRPPLSPDRPLVDWSLGLRMFYIALIMAIGSVLVFWFYLDKGLIYAQTATLITVVFYEWYALLIARSATLSVFKQSLSTNKIVPLSIALSLALTVGAVYIEPIAHILHLTAVDWTVWLVGGVVGLSLIVLDEIRKLIVRQTIKSM